MKKIILNQKSYLSYDEILKFEKEYSKLKKNDYDYIFFPQVTYLSMFNDKDYLVGSQNFYSYNYGAYFGEISLESLKSLHINYTIVSHPERKKFMLESYSISKEKLYKSLKSKFNTILFVGELKKTKSFRYVKKELNYFLRDIEFSNLKYLSICYCPYVGLGEEEKEVKDIEKNINKINEYIFNKYNIKCEIYYGGFVNKSNIKDIISICDGVVINKESTNINELKDIISTLYDLNRQD